MATKKAATKKAAPVKKAAPKAAAPKVTYEVLSAARADMHQAEAEVVANRNRLRAANSFNDADERALRVAQATLNLEASEKALTEATALFEKLRAKA